MRRSKIRVPLQFVWATYERRPLIVPELEPHLYRIILSEARKKECTVLAIGGTLDHVHLAVWFPATAEIKNLMKQVKGVSSAWARDRLGPDSLFRWQSGYGAFGCGHTREDVDELVSYVRNQKRHHAEGTVREEWEEPTEEVPDHLGDPS